MSFSAIVKEEIVKHISSSRHCQIAELAAMIHYCGKIADEGQDGYTILVQTENAGIARKCFTLLKKTFNIGTDVAGLDEEHKGKGNLYFLKIDRKEADLLLQSLKLVDLTGKIPLFEKPIHPTIIKNSCCRRAFLRGAFLCIGSMSDPNKSYHLEFVCTNEPQANQIKEVISSFAIDAKIVLRKKNYVVYVKEGSGIVDFLNIIEAHVSLMNLENLRILKEMRNSINRRVNCEAANITKTVEAASKQKEDILYIKEHYGLDNLPVNLRQIAEIRLEYPDASLVELGQLSDPPVGKSGVNHRLRKLCEIADKLR